MTMELDPLRDEGEAYALRMQDAGVQVEYTMWKGQFHGSQNMKKLIPEEASAYQEMIVEGLRDAFA
jgi:acetyl esterase